MENEQSGIEARLARLERSNWRLRLGLAACLCGFAALGLMGATAGVPRVIRAQRFEVVNSSGQKVDSLGLQSYGSRLYNNLVMGAQPGHSLALGQSGLQIHEGSSFAVLTPQGLDMHGSAGDVELDAGSERPMPAAERLLSRIIPPQVRDHIQAMDATEPILELENGSGTVTVNFPGPSPAVSLADSAGYSMTLGGASLVSPTTGETRQTSAASIVMFGNSKDHHVIWQAPNP